MRFMMPRERSTRPAATALLLMLALAIACGGSAETTGTQPLLPALEPTSTAAPPLTLEPTSTTAPRPTLEPTSTTAPPLTLEPTSTTAPRPTLEPTRGTPIPTLNPRQIQATQTVRVSYRTPVPTLPMTVLYRTPVPTLPMTVLYRTPVPTLPMTVLYRTPVPTLPMTVLYRTPVPTLPMTVLYRTPVPTLPMIVSYRTPVPTEPPSALRSNANEVFLGQIQSLDAIVTNFRFFESGYDRVPLEERVFEASFDQRTARYIEWQMDHIASVPTEEYVIETKTVLYNSEREVLSTLVMLDKLNLDRTYSYFAWGHGYEEPGHWVPGHYWVEVLVDGTLVAAGGFEVVGP